MFDDSICVPTNAQLPGQTAQLVQDVLDLNQWQSLGSLPAPQTVPLSGGAKVLGLSGFEASVTGTASMAVPQTAVVEMAHAGGWAPFPGALSPYFASPQFNATLMMGVDGKYLQIRASSPYTTAIALHSLVAIVPDPSSNPVLNVSVDMATKQSTPSIKILFDGLALRLGDGSVGWPPMLALSGEVVWPRGTTVLNVQTSTPWQPLPQRIPQLIFPAIAGHLEVKPEAGTVAATVGTLTGTGLSLPDTTEPLVELIGWMANVTLDDFEPAAWSGTAPPVHVEVSGSVRLLGATGFMAAATGSLDLVNQAMNVSLSHPGGWSPFSGALSQPFTSPAFLGVASVGANGNYIEAHATMQYTSTLVVVQDVLHVMAHGAHPTLPGPRVDIGAVRNSANGASAVRLGFLGSLQLGDGSAGMPPVLDLSGDIAWPNGTTALNASTSTPWQPLAQSLPQLIFPALDGRLELKSGEDKLWARCVSTTPVAVKVPYLSNYFVHFKDFFGTVELADLDMATWDGTAPPPLIMTATGTVNVYGLQMATTAAIDVPASSMEMTLSHPGGWDPLGDDFGGIFTTPAMDGTGTHNKEDGKFLHLNATATYPTPLTLLDVIELAGHTGGTGPGTGPTFNLNLTMDSVHHRPAYDIQFSGIVRLLSGAGQMLGTEIAEDPPPLVLQGSVSLRRI